MGSSWVSQLEVSNPFNELNNASQISDSVIQRNTAKLVVCGILICIANTIITIVFGIFVIGFSEWERESTRRELNELNLKEPTKR